MSAQAIQQAMLIVKDPAGKTGYPLTADQLDELGADLAAEVLAHVLHRRSDATEVSLRLELPDRVSTTRWDPRTVTAEQFAMVLRAPSPRAPQGGELLIQRLFRWGRWTLHVAKEVGPPRWRWPRVRVGVNRRRANGVAGWNFTAFHFYLGWGEDQ